MIYNNNAECEIIFLRSSFFNRTGRKISSRVCRCARPQGCSSIVRMFGSGMWVAAVDSTTRAHSPTPLRNVMAWGRDNFATYTTMKQNNKRTEAKSGCKMYKQLCFSIKSQQIALSKRMFAVFVRYLQLLIWAFYLTLQRDTTYCRLRQSLNIKN